MRPGDTVYTAPGIWHWHGAMPDSFMTHLALSDSGARPGGQGGAADVEWDALVSDAEYITAGKHLAADRSTS
jgi:hypothetical protein